MSWKLRGRCFSCRRQRWFVAHRSIYIPQINQVATPKDLMCGKCAKRLQIIIGKP